MEIFLKLEKDENDVVLREDVKNLFEIKKEGIKIKFEED